MSDMVDMADPMTNGERYVMDGMMSPPTGNLPTVYPSAQGDVAINSFGGVVTAQRVAVPRNHNAIIQKLKALCAMAGDGYVYSWPVKDRKNQREQIVEGPTIKLANDLARTYGNCQIDVRVQRDGDWLVIYARFTDLETGYSYTRPFQQRMNQDTGMKDAERRMDMVFQIGVSKAIRNVVVNALSTFADFMVEEAKNNLIAKVQENPDKAHGFIDKVLDRFEIDVARVEAVIGRKRDKWTVRDLARVYQEMRGLVDGMTNADELYPTAEAAAEVMVAKQTDKADLKPEGGAKTAKAGGKKGAQADAGATDGKPQVVDRLSPEAIARGERFAKMQAENPGAEIEYGEDGEPRIVKPAATDQQQSPAAATVFSIFSHDGLSQRADTPDAAAKGLARYITDADGDVDALMAVRNKNVQVLALRPELAIDIQNRLDAAIAKTKAATDAAAAAKGGNDKLSGTAALFGDE